MRRPPGRHRGRALLVVVGGLLSVGGLAWRQGWPPFVKPVQTAAAPPPVPVVVAPAVVRAVPLTLAGLGAVQAYNTVTVRVRVDGQLTRIAFMEGQDVKEGDLLAQIDARPFQAQLAQAQAKLAQDQAQLANAQLILSRYETLVSRQDVSRSSYDTQAAAAATLAAQVKADQAAIAYAATQLAYTQVTAPITGRTGARLIDIGNIVHATDTTGLVVITQLDPIFVRFSLSQDALDQVQAAIRASPALLQVQAYGRDAALVLATGQLSLVNNQVDPATGMVEFKATFPNTDHILWPGRFVTARIRLGVRQDGMTVPAAAVQRGPDGTYAWVVGADGTVAMRPVKVAQIQDGTALFDGGLAAGDQVVVDGQFKLKPGVKVAPGAVPAAAGER